MSAHLANKRFESDERVRSLDEERREDSRDNGAIVEKMVKALGNYSAPISMATLASKSAAKSINQLTPGQLKQLDEINAINKTSTSLNLEAAPYTKYLGEIAGALGVAQQIMSSRTKAREQGNISDNITKSVYHLQNGGKFGDITGAIGAGTAKNLMASAGMLSAGSWLHDMATTGQISNLTSSSLTMANPGMMAAGMFGGITGLGNATGAIGSGALSGLGSITGIEALSKGAKALSTLDPTVATILGTVSMLGIGVGANKLLNNAIKNSPLASEKRESRWNLRHQRVRSVDNPVSMSNYMQSNNILKQMANQQMLSPAETQMISKLNEIAFYTSTIQDLHDSMANKGLDDRNSGTRALNKIDKSIVDKDMSGMELQNLFKDGKLSDGMLSFLKHNEGLGYLASLLNPGTYFRSLTGRDTAPGQFKIREALQQGDPEGAKKDLARKANLTLSDVDLLHADFKERIGNADTSYEGRLLASGVYQTMLLQLIATKMVEQGSGVGGTGNNGLIGALAKLQEEQDRRYQENQNVFIDGTIKPIMKWMSTVPGLSMAVPVLHAGKYIINSISGASEFLGNPKKTLDSIKNTFQDMKDRAIDSMKVDEVKNEKSVRNRIGANALSLQDQANMYIARYLPQDMQKLQWLLGSKEKSKVQDRYTGEFVTPEELRTRYQKMAAQVRDLTTQVNPEDSYLDEVKNWGLKKIFKIKDEDIRVASHKNYSHINDILRELKISKIKSDEQTDDTEFRLNPSEIGQKGTPLYSSLNFLTNQIKKFGNQESSGQEDTIPLYQQNINEYLPLLEDIKNNTINRKLSFNNPFPEPFKGPSQNSTAPGTQETQGTQGIQGLQGLNPFNLLKIPSSETANNPKFSKINQNIQEQVEASQAQNLMDKLNNLYFTQLPYLEKIHTEIKKLQVPKKEEPKKEEQKDGLLSLISGLGGFILDNILDLFGFGKGAFKKGMKTAGNLSGKISGGLMRMAATLAKPGPLAIGAGVAMLAGAGIDYFFNDGKNLKGMWSALKESSFGQTISSMWESSTEFIKKGIDFFSNFATYIAEAIASAWNGTKDVFNNVVDGTKNAVKQFFGMDNDYKKEAMAQIANLPNDNERLKAIAQNKNLSGAEKKEMQEAILNQTNQRFEQKYKISVTPEGIQQYYDNNFKNADAQTQAQFYNDFNESLAQQKMVQPIGKNYEEWYNKLNSQMAESFKQKMEQIQVPTNTPESIEQQKQLQETLKSIQEQSLTNTTAINKIVQTNQQLGIKTIQGINEQLNGLANSQQNIASVLNITAKTAQKPNIIELDNHVISVLPILKG